MAVVPQFGPLTTKAFAEGGYINTTVAYDEYPPQYYTGGYVVPNGITWMPPGEPVAYTEQVRTKNGQWIDIPVLGDGTVKVEKSALLELLSKAGII